MGALEWWGQQHHVCRRMCPGGVQGICTIEPFYFLRRLVMYIPFSNVLSSTQFIRLNTKIGTDKRRSSTPNIRRLIIHTPVFRNRALMRRNLCIYFLVSTINKSTQFCCELTLAFNIEVISAV